MKSLGLLLLTLLAARAHAGEFIGEYPLGGSVPVTLTVCSPLTGDAADAFGSPTYRIYAAGSETLVASGTLSKLDDANTTGAYRTTLTVSTGAGYAEGSYTVILTATIEGISPPAEKTFRVSSVAANAATAATQATTAASVVSGVNESVLDEDTGLSALAGKLNALDDTIGVDGAGLTALPLDDLLTDLAAAIDAAITPFAAKDVFASRTWRPGADGATADNVVTVKQNFSGSLMALMPLNEDGDIQGVESVSITGAATVTATTLRKSGDGRGAIFDVPTLATKGNYTVIVTVSTADDQEIPMECKLVVR